MSLIDVIDVIDPDYELLKYGSEVYDQFKKLEPVASLFGKKNIREMIKIAAEKAKEIAKDKQVKLISCDIYTYWTALGNQPAVICYFYISDNIERASMDFDSNSEHEIRVATFKQGYLVAISVSGADVYYKCIKMVEQMNEAKKLSSSSEGGT